MKNLRQAELFTYRLFDWLMAALAWLIFYVYRRNVELADISLPVILSEPKLHLGLIIIPLGWIIFYSIFDKYSDIYRYSRLGTLRRTFVLSFIGTLFLFFTILIDDTTLKHTTYLFPFLTLFGWHFGLTALSRIGLLSWAKRRLVSGKIRYKTLIIGGDEGAVELYKEMQDNAKVVGHDFVGFLSTTLNNSQPLAEYLKPLGRLEDLENIIIRDGIEEAIIAIQPTDQKKIKEVLDILYGYKNILLVKVIPDMYDIMLGKVKMNHVYGAGLIEIDQELMPKSSRIMKRSLDVISALILIVVSLPLFLFLAIKVRLSSKGPLLYKQTRIGKDTRPFEIMKFRSMYTDAEKDGPQLSDDHDPRITPFGRFMRKWRLDEIPQFFNLLKGDMSLVGPRPERQHFIDLITKEEPLYRHLLKVRPGITSWGQVKFGYASNVKEMVQRMKYDLIYLENMSLSQDIKILFYTLLILLQGKGK